MTGLALFCLGCLVTFMLGIVTGIVPPGRLASLFGGASLPSAANTASTATTNTTSVAPKATPTPAPATGAAQVRTVRDEAIGDWRLTCVQPSAADAKPVCSILQQLRVAETGAAVFVWRVVADGKGGLVGMWQVADTIDQKAGLTLEAGTPKPITMPFEACGDGSCRVTGNLTPDFVAALSKATSVSASVTLNDGKPVSFPLSAKGLAAALAALAATDSGT